GRPRPLATAAVLRRPPRSAVLPYTTLFRAHVAPPRVARRVHVFVRMVRRPARVHAPAALQLRDRAPDQQLGERRIIEIAGQDLRSEEHTSELQSRENLVCRLLLEQKNTTAT